MRLKLAILAILLVFGGAGAVVWRALHPPVGLFLASGATDIQVIDIDMGAQLITYHAPGAAYAWRATVERNLVQRGWVNPPWWHPGLPELNYIHRSEFGLGTLWSEVELRGDPHIAQIIVRRWVEAPLWWGVPWWVVGGEGSHGR